MAPDLIARFHSWISSRGGRFFVMYGQTEATARISILPAGSLPAKLGSVGLPIPGGQVSVQDDAGTLSELNIEGELVYSGPNVMLGYASGRADLALGSVTQGVLHTGDKAFLDAEGFIFITGRAARDAKLFGLRINLDEIESMLRIHGPVAVVSKGEKLRIYCEHGDPEFFSLQQRELAARLRIHYEASLFRADRKDTGDQQRQNRLSEFGGASMNFELLLNSPQYSLTQGEKEAALTPQFDELTRHHRERCPPYDRLLSVIRQDYGPARSLAGIPFVPVSLFKTHRLSSVPETEVSKLSPPAAPAVSR